MLNASPQGLADELREHTNRLLVQRLGAAVWVILFANVLFAVINLGYPQELFAALYTLKAAQTGCVVLAWCAVKRTRARGWPTAFLLLTVTAVGFGTAASGVLTQDAVTSPLILMILVLAVAALLPWGVWAQLAAASTIAAEAWWNVSVVSGLPSAVSIGAFVVAFVTSVFVAYESQRYRAAIVQHDRERKRSEDAVRRSERQFRSLIENASDLITVVDWDGTIRYESPSQTRIMGFASDEVEGRNVWEFVHPEDRAHALSVVTRRITNSGEREPLLVRIRHKDGSWHLMETLATILPEGSSFGPLVINSRDVTERTHTQAALQESEVRYRELFENASDIVYVQDLNWNFLSINRAAEELIGYARGEAVGQNAARVIAPEHVERAVEATRRKLAGEPSPPYEVDLITKDGRRVTVELNTRLIYRDGQPVAIQGTGRDITARKRMEAELQQAKEAAEAANRAKSEFVANMSHEIRTPMNGIIGMTELALNTTLTAEQREYIETVRISADALLAVINDILDFSKIEAGRLDLLPVAFNLREHLDSTIKPLAVRAQQKGLQLILRVAPEVPDALVGDASRLRQILINLVGNAIKFTEHGEVAVEVAGLQSPVVGPESPASSLQSPMELHFAVRDTGIGIPPEKQSLIFAAFAQADSSTSRCYGGTGLGLTISSQLVSLMGGRIWVESSVGAGSTFHCTVRVHRQDESRQPVPVELAYLHGLPVLVVVDDATNRRILEETLVQWQMEPTVADTGPVALTLIERAKEMGKPFALILIDVHAPQTDGFALVESIQRTPRLSGATLMILTSDGQPGDAARCRELGVAAYLTTPMHRDDLLNALLTSLGMPPPTASPPGVHHPTPAPARLTPLRVLLAEDNVINQKLTVRMLEKRGHSVAVANTGQEVLAALDRERFDVVLMDVQMPVMDGLEATAEIRRREAAISHQPSAISPPHLPIIAITAHAMKGDEERCLAAGMDAYVSKPVQAETLLAAIARVVHVAGEPQTAAAAAEVAARR